MSLAEKVVSLESAKENELGTRLIETMQYNREILEDLVELSYCNWLLSQTREGRVFLDGLGKGILASLLFFEPSTRTLESFKVANNRMGIKFSVIQDLKATSCAKGEKDLDLIKTLVNIGIELFIIRHSDDEFIYKVAEVLPDNAILINAGNGTIDHPTQALLDYVAIRRKQFDSKEKVVTLVGDLKRGRASKAFGLMTNFLEDLNGLYLVSQTGYQAESDFLNQLNTGYDKVTDDKRRYKALLQEGDLFSFFRVQQEREEIAYPWDEDMYYVDESNANMMKPSALYMHPLPHGPEVRGQAMLNHRCMIRFQEACGPYSRMAVEQVMLGLDQPVREEAAKVKKILPTASHGWHQ